MTCCTSVGQPIHLVCRSLRISIPSLSHLCRLALSLLCRLACSPLPVSPPPSFALAWQTRGGARVCIGRMFKCSTECLNDRRSGVRYCSYQPFNLILMRQIMHFCIFAYLGQVLLFRLCHVGELQPSKCGSLQPHNGHGFCATCQTPACENRIESPASLLVWCDSLLACSLATSLSFLPVNQLSVILTCKFLVLLD